MPSGNGTGPAGMGPMTGRAAGYCAGYGVAGFTNPVGGRGCMGWGRAHGGGRGRRNWFYATGLTGWQRAVGGPAAGAAPTMGTKQQLDALKEQAEYFKGAMEEIRKRIEQLEAEDEQD